MSNEPLTTQEKEEIAGENQEVFQLRVSESKRTALLRYLIIMFAVAFVLVLMSMVLQVHSSNATVSELHQSSTSAMAKAQKLQDDNRALSDKVAVLEQELTGVTATLEEYSAANNALRAEVKALEEGKVDETALRAACDALAESVMAAKKEERSAEDVEALTKLKQYLSPERTADFEKWLENNQ